MTKPYEIAVVLTEHTTKKDLDPYADYDGVALRVAHTQVVHDTILSPAEECVGAGLSPIRTVQILSSSLAAVIQQVGTVDAALAGSLVESAVSQVIDAAPDVSDTDSDTPDTCSWSDGELAGVVLTKEQRTSLALLERNPVYRKKQ